MKTQSPDTPPEIEEILLEGYRRMTPFEKLWQVFELNLPGGHLHESQFGTML